MFTKSFLYITIIARIFTLLQYKQSISITSYHSKLPTPYQSCVAFILQLKRRPTPQQPNENIFLSNFNTLHTTNAIHKAFAIRNINLYIAAYAYLTIRLFATACKGLCRNSLNQNHKTVETRVYPAKQFLYTVD